MTGGRLSHGQRGQLANGWFTDRDTIPLLTTEEEAASPRRGERDKGFAGWQDSSATLLLSGAEDGEQMEWLGKMIIHMRRVCGGVASRIRSRQSGLLKLRRDVRACEYEDVRVMWEMVKRNEAELDPSHGGRKRQLCSFIGWARSAPCLGRRF